MQHALKSSLVPVLHEALEQDIMDIVASVVGGIMTFVLQVMPQHHASIDSMSLFCFLGMTDM